MIFNFLDIEQFISILIIHLFAVISPGPDFFIVVKQSFKSRLSGIFTSLGIALGILFHVFYCVLGVSYFIVENNYIFNAIKIAGGLYLCFLGISSFLSNGNIPQINKDNFYKKEEQSYLIKSDFFIGFFTNLLNPKATLFFLSLFVLIIDIDTSLYAQIFYGFWMSLITGLWFCLVSLLISSYYLNIFINRYFTLLNKIMGVLLIFISMKIVFM